MKYTVINHTTLEIIETDNIVVALDNVSYWRECNHKIEVVDNSNGEIIVDTRREDQIMYSYSEMIKTIEDKYGVDSHEVITLKLMWIAYRGGGKRITPNKIIEYYKKLLTK